MCDLDRSTEIEYDDEVASVLSENSTHFTPFVVQSSAEMLELLHRETEGNNNSQTWLPPTESNNGSQFKPPHPKYSNHELCTNNDLGCDKLAHLFGDLREVFDSTTAAELPRISSKLNPNTARSTGICSPATAAKREQNNARRWQSRDELVLKQTNLHHHLQHYSLTEAAVHQKQRMDMVNRDMMQNMLESNVIEEKVSEFLMLCGLADEE